jgi:cell division protein ZapA
MTTTLDIKIQGRDYRVACAPEEMTSLQAAADVLNARMNELAKSTKSTGERLAVMAALNLADELNKARAAPAGTQAGAAEKAVDSVDTEEVRRKIKAIEAQLDEALLPQEKLF